jgi:Cysteine-rich secretory protein family
METEWNLWNIRPFRMVNDLMDYSPKSLARKGRSRPRGLPFVYMLISGVAGCGDSGLAPDFDPEVEAYVSQVNAYRSTVGCAPLKWNRDVAQVAQDHSLDMVARNFFGHVNPDGRGPLERLGDAGIEWFRAAENIAFEVPTADAVLESWLADGSQGANIENCRLTEHGVGLFEANWTQVFFSPP